MDLEQLRRETRPQHEATERTVPLMHEGLTRQQYGDVLLRFFGIIRAWDHWSMANASQHLQTLLAGRQRSALLADDLRALGLPLPADDWGPELSLAADEPAFLGAMYVIEGSTLGGQYIARHVEQQLSLTPGAGDAYFRGYGEQTGAMWNSFKSVLAALPQDQAPAVIHAAKNMFDVFADWMQPLLTAHNSK